MRRSRSARVRLPPPTIAPACRRLGSESAAGGRAAAPSSARSTGGSCGRRCSSSCPRSCSPSFTVARPGPAPGAVAATLVRRGRRRRDWRPSSPATIRAGCRDGARRRGRGALVRGEARALRPRDARRTPGEEDIPGLGRRTAAQHRHDRAGRSAEDAIVVRRSSRQQRAGAGRERQRVRHGRADRARARLRDSRARRPDGRRPLHTLVFLSSDGGAYGGVGAERFASTSPLRDNLIAVVSLDGIGGHARPRLELAGCGGTLARARARAHRVACGSRSRRRASRPGPTG